MLFSASSNNNAVPAGGGAQTHPIRTRPKRPNRAASHQFRLNGLAAILILFGIIAGISFMGLRRAAASAVQLTHTGDIRNALLSVRTELEDAESGERGYLITHQRSYLGPYTSALPAIDSHFADLRRLTLEDSDQQRRLQTLESVINERVGLLTEIIRLTDLHRDKEALDIVATNRGQRLMTRARALLDEIGNTEEKHWRAHSASAERTARLLQVGFVPIFLLTVLLLVYGFRRISREEDLRDAADSALNDFRERHALAIESAELGTWSWDLEKNELLWSDRCKAMFGLPADTAMTTEVFESALHPDDLRSTQEATRKSLRQHKDYDVDYRTVWPDGSVHWVRSKGRPEVDSAGKTVRFQGIVIDIDERERAREALRRSEQRYAALFRNKLNAIVHCRCIYDDAGVPLDFEIVEVNEAYSAITGLPAGFVEKKLAREAFPGIENASFDYIGVYGQIARDGGERSFETWFAPLNQWLSIYVYSPLRGEVIAIFTDISSRKSAEKALQTSEERLRLAQSAAGVGVWEWKPESGEMTCTPELSGLYSLGSGTAYSYPEWHRCVHPEDAARVESARKKLFVEGGSSDIEFRVVHRNDQVRWVYEKGAALLDGSNAVVRVLGVALDISNRKALETELRNLNETLEKRVALRTEELASANRDLEAFSYSVSHDLRTPLRGIDGFSRILLAEAGTQLEPRSARYLQLIRDNARRMSELIDDLLAFSKLNREPLRKEWVDPGALVREVLEDLQFLHAGREIEFAVGELAPCLAEPKMLRQVWFNLLSNAIKFTAKTAKARVEVGSRVPEGDITPSYFVRDNGAGFDMRYADKLFGVFQRLHRVEDYEGTGVGLAIVARIVRRHGGYVRAAGIPDEGATFSFTLSGGTWNGADGGNDGAHRISAD